MFRNFRLSHTADAILCMIGFAVFAFFIQDRVSLRIFAICGLLIPAYIIGRQIHSFTDIRKNFYESGSFSRILYFILPALIAGLFFAALYRSGIGMPLFPTSLKGFAIIAAVIGSIEEIIFRGFIQGHLRKVNTVFSVIFGSFSHTVYKTALFLSPVLVIRVDISFLAFWTFVAGIVFGLLKHFSRSTIPPVIAHALFDVLVYGNLAAAPWWVW